MAAAQGWRITYQPHGHIVQHVRNHPFSASLHAQQCMIETRTWNLRSTQHLRDTYMVISSATQGTQLCACMLAHHDPPDMYTGSNSSTSGSCTLQRCLSLRAAIHELQLLGSQCRRRTRISSPEAAGASGS